MFSEEQILSSSASDLGLVSVAQLEWVCQPGLV